MKLRVDFLEKINKIEKHLAGLRKREMTLINKTRNEGSGITSDSTQIQNS